MQREKMMIGNSDLSDLQIYPHPEMMWDKTTDKKSAA